MTRGTFFEARRLLSSAVVDVYTRREAALLRGVCALCMHELPESSRLLDEAAQLALSASNQEGHGLALAWRSITALQTGKIVEAEALAQAAEKAVSSTHVSVLAEAHVRLLTARTYVGVKHGPKAQKAMQIALANAQKIGSKVLAIDVALSHAAIKLSESPQDRSAARGILEKALVEAKEIDYRRAKGEVLLRLADVEFRSRALEKSQALADRAESVFKEMGYMMGTDGRDALNEMLSGSTAARSHGLALIQPPTS
jgi:hypothetical protein